MNRGQQEGGEPTGRGDPQIHGVLVCGKGGGKGSRRFGDGGRSWMTAVSELEWEARWASLELCGLEGQAGRQGWGPGEEATGKLLLP